jgi:D-alanyl-D-alanine carboxypeptidase/D-alanyl-D-alanine-endopeptidase (penicillin-binding protein 4)
MRKFTMGLILAVLGVWPLFGQEIPSADKVTAALSEVTGQGQYKHAHWGILIADRQSGAVVYEQNADKLFVPASCTKLFSVACALDCFGPEHRFQTPIVRRGEVSDGGELGGDLILVASGDLAFGGRTNDKGEIEFTYGDHIYADGGSDTELTAADPLAGLNDLAHQVAESGIKRVRGDVLIDDRLFDKGEGTGSGPGRLTPIMINDNLIDLTIEPGKAGEPAKISWRPQTAAIQVECKVETTAKDSKLETSLVDLGSGRLCVRGQIPEGHKRIIRVYEIPDAASFARSLLIEALARAGVTVEAPTLAANSSGNLPSREDVGKLPRVALHTSPPLSQSVRLVLKVSHNLHASTLPLLVAARHGDRTLAQGLRRQHDFLERVGVDVETISFGGGAGGSRADYTTPRATVALLHYMATRPDFAVYHDALPTLGVDGTLAKAVSADSPARGKAFAKTGTLYWYNAMNSRMLLTSKALAGYLTTSHDRELAFAFFVNNVHLRDGVDAKSIGRDLGRLCEIVHEQQ